MHWNTQEVLIFAFPGQVVYSERSIEARVLACEDVQNKTQASLIPPYNFGPVISGQGTTALEILEQVRQVSFY